MTVLGPNRYGKAEVRVVSIQRGDDGPDGLVDRNVSISLAGQFTAVHLSGDNTDVLPTDTQKNMVYVMAKRLGPVEPEAFALALARHFVGTPAAVTRARVAVEQYGWDPIPASPHSFSRRGDRVRTTTVTLDAEAGASVVSGVQKLIVMNTTNSEFWGFYADEYTTLAATRDRILATEVSAWWRFRAGTADGTADATATDWDAVDWAGVDERARTALYTAFADTYSYSLQQTLYAIGERILAAAPEVCEVRLALPNKHHFRVDLSPFGMTNDNEVYYAADRPYGFIEGHVLADDADPDGLAWT